MLNARRISCGIIESNVATTTTMEKKKKHRNKRRHFYFLIGIILETCSNNVLVKWKERQCQCQQQARTKKMCQQYLCSSIVCGSGCVHILFYYHDCYCYYVSSSVLFVFILVSPEILWANKYCITTHCLVNCILCMCNVYWNFILLAIWWTFL